MKKIYINSRIIMYDIKQQLAMKTLETAELVVLGESFTLSSNLRIIIMETCFKLVDCLEVPSYLLQYTPENPWWPSCDFSNIPKTCFKLTKTFREGYPVSTLLLSWFRFLLITYLSSLAQAINYYWVLFIAPVYVVVYTLHTWFCFFIYSI